MDSRKLAEEILDRLFKNPQIIEEEKEEDDEEVKEASDEDEVEEDFEDIAIEADDEEDMMGGDPTDDLEAELDAGEEDLADKEPEELFQDLDAIVDELQAKFDAMNGGEMGGDEGGEMKDAFDPELETVREYVEKVPAGHGAEKKGAAEQADKGAGSPLNGAPGRAK